MKPYDLNVSSMLIVVKIIKEDNDTFDTGRVYKCVPCTIDYEEKEGGVSHIIEALEDRAIYCMSLHEAILIENRYYVAYQITKGKFVIHNQAVFLDL